MAAGDPKMSKKALRKLAAKNRFQKQAAIFAILTKVYTFILTMFPLVKYALDRIPCCSTIWLACYSKMVSNEEYKN